MKVKPFKNLSPRAKAVAILDGYESIAAKVQLLHLDLVVLNGWIEDAPGLIENGLCDVPNTNSMARLITSLEESNDVLTDEYIRHVELMRRLTDCILRNA